MFKIKNKKTRLASFGLTIFFLVLFLFATYSFAVSPLRNLAPGEFVLNIKADQKVDLTAKKVEISKLLQEISKQADVDITVKEEAGKEKVSLIIKDKPLAEAIKRIVGSNYVLSFKRNKKGFEVTKGNVLNVKDRVKEFIGSFIIDGPVAKMFFMPNGSSPESIADYIKERHKFLDELAEKYPNKVIDAQISLKDFLTGDEILSIASKYDVKVKVFNPGWEDFGGESGVDENDSLQQSLKKLNEDEKEMLKGFMAMVKGDEIEEAKFKEYWDSVEEKGAMIYGIKLEGKTTELKKMKDEAKQVRLADPLWKGSLYNLLQKTHIVSPIAIPLSPYSEPVSELE